MLADHSASEEPTKIQSPKGTLDLLILRVVALAPVHGYAIAQRMQLIWGETLQVQQGSLSPALHRLENKKFRAAEWGPTETGREAKFYRPTAKGRTQLKSETESWVRLTEGVGLILADPQGGACLEELRSFLRWLGLLGMVAWPVTQRTREIAIRLALGASRLEIFASILRRFAWPVATGLLLGVATTAALSQVIRRGLFGISGLDPVSYAAAILLLLVVLTAAALIPIRRAFRLDVARILHAW